MLKIHNSLTKKKEIVKPIKAGEIKLYVCGITVYDYCHIGHSRSMLVFDMVNRFLRSQGWKVTFVRNITDIDDKIIKRANENNESVKQLTARFIQAMHEDQAALGMLPPDYEPRATEFIPQMVALTQALIEAGMAYQAENGDVYFSIEKFPDYGKLSHRQLEDLISGARVAIGEAKRNPLDFVLWKMSKPDEPQWDSPWGAGRPGWHLECSVMSTHLLGQPFDIHGGGMDLKFPHHENEIAQSESASHKNFANYWMHNGLLNVDGEKMSKSLGNFFTIREVLAEHHPEVIRYFILSPHYRSPINYTKENIDKAQQSLASLYLALRHLSLPETYTPSDYSSAFNEAMNDDFNTPKAIAVLFEMAHEINRLKETQDTQKAQHIAAELKALAKNIGVLQCDPKAFLQGDLVEAEVSQINALIAARNKARAEKDWAKADSVRDELQAMGVIIEDTPNGTTWRKE